MNKPGLNSEVLDYLQVPIAMRQANRWVNARSDKVPCDANGNPIDVTNPENHLPFDTALQFARDSGGHLGLGFALGDGWQGIDLDNVEANGLQELANSLPGYVEVSPSGRGCHAIGNGCSFPALKLKGIEAYSEKRYFTVTGNAIGGEICDLARFVASHLEPLRPRPSNAPLEPPSLPTLSDADIVGRLHANPRHAALYGGDLTGREGDHSRGDLDLCNVLALTGCSPGQAERIWRASPLGQREKTQQRADYRQRTIEKAFATKPPELPMVSTNFTANGKLFLAPQAPAYAPTVIDVGNWEGEPVKHRLYVWNGWLPAGQVTYLGGAGAAGKSLLCQQLATSTALGLPCLGIQTMRGVALYVTCEDDAGELHRRQVAICAALGVKLRDLRQQFGIMCLTGMIANELATFDRNGSMLPAPAYAAIEAQIRAMNARLVILDNVAHFFAGDENNRHQVAAFIGLLNRLAADTGAAIVLIGHPAKSGNGYSGSTAWENQVRTRLLLQTPQEGSGFIPDRDARTLTRAKSNYDRGGEVLSFRWHNHAFVNPSELPTDVGAVIAANAQAESDDKVFLACLAERTRQRRPVSELASRTYAPAVFAGMRECQGVGKARLEAAMDRLFRAGAIERGFLWRDKSEGKDRHGLRLASANPPADDPLTPSANDRQPDRQPPLIVPPTPPYTTCIDGGACSGPRYPDSDGGEADRD